MHLQVVLSSALPLRISLRADRKLDLSADLSHQRANIWTFSRFPLCDEATTIYFKLYSRPVFITVCKNYATAIKSPRNTTFHTLSQTPPVRWQATSNLALIIRLAWCATPVETNSAAGHDTRCTGKTHDMFWHNMVTQELDRMKTPLPTLECLSHKWLFILRSSYQVKSSEKNEMTWRRNRSKNKTKTKMRHIRRG